ncbi:MAG: system, fructose family, component [Massilibacillus sp.]|jgi:PTS system fructose-specific IIC component|nr:system, fructose family, component [Massilibacillus sp.]
MEAVLFDINTIKLDVKAKTKDEVINEMIDLLDNDHILKDREMYKKSIYVREEMSTTGIGFGIAIPHAKTSAVNKPRVAFGLSKEGVDYDSEDGERVNLIFMIAVSDTDNNLHVQTLAKLSRKLINPVFRNNLMQCKTKKEVLVLLEAI